MWVDATVMSEERSETVNHCLKWMGLMCFAMGMSFTLHHKWAMWIQFSVCAASFILHAALSVNQIYERHGN